MAQLLHRLIRNVDKEWIKVGWAGMPTLRHNLLALTPLVIFLVPAMIVEPWNYDAGAAILLIGMLMSSYLIIWINLRKLAGLGYFSSVRSDRVAKRQQRRRARLPTS
jgi:hypothetical protein